jgi:hypothetical protein
MSPRQLRFGVLVAGTTLAVWQADCLCRLTARGRAELVLRIELRSENDRVGTSQRLGGNVLNRWWRLVERRSRALRPVLTDASLMTRAQSLQVAPNDWAAAVAAIRHHNLDFILDLSGGQAPGSALADAARNGVWRFWHGPITSDGSVVTYFNHSQSADEPLRLALVAVRGPAASLLFEGFFRRRRSALRNLDRCLLAAGDCLVAACLNLLSQGASVGPTHPVPTSRRIYLPTKSTLALLLRQAVSLLDLAADVFRLDIWNVGILKCPATMALHGFPQHLAEWMPEPPVWRYYADPSALPGRPGMLVEEFDYWTGRGRIQSLAVAGWEKLQPQRLDTGLHMSYPYLLVDEEEVFCIPESAEIGGIPLFRAISFPDRWERVSTLIEGFPAVDGTMFRYGGTWWLFCTKAGNLSDTQLFIWHAESPRGPWHPHRQNPVKIDVRSSRPAGPPFVVDGILYRPAQDCSRTYGGALAINRVLTLDRERFTEEVAVRLEPDPAGPYPHGLHTLCGCGDVTLIDGKRTSFHIAAPALKAWSALAHRRLRRRVRLNADAG